MRATRRALLRALFLTALAGGTAAALTPVLTADRNARRPRAPRAPGAPGALRGEVLFDETYRGRRLRGSRTGSPAAHGTGTRTGPDTVRVTVDGRPLHLMRRADGGYLTVVDHYVSYPTPLAAARAAVDELGAAHLSASPTHRA
ncbi:tyrosinase family oxidase copper chaperone [Streptomyces sp. NPDC059816]|uniref:tyrosinase family oxidase copper chaperone n=1 Tax=Streptomyces sp. NPDC059816 TaxID=3346960 RepID=UPI00365DF857